MSKYAAEYANSDTETGQAVRAIGHDLRNQLAVMRNSTYYLRMRVGNDDPKIARHLEILDQSIEQANHKVLDLMDYVLPRTPAVEPCSLLVLASTFLNYWHTDAEIEQASFDVGLTVSIDKTQIDRALQLLAEALHERQAACLSCKIVAGGGYGIVTCELDQALNPPLCVKRPPRVIPACLSEYMAAGLFELNHSTLAASLEAQDRHLLNLGFPLG